MFLCYSPEHAVAIFEQFQVSSADAEFAVAQIIGGGCAVHFLRNDAFATDEFFQGCWKRAQVWLISPGNPGRKSALGHTHQVGRKRLFVLTNACQLSDVIAHAVMRRWQD